MICIHFYLSQYHSEKFQTPYTVDFESIRQREDPTRPNEPEVIGKWDLGSLDDALLNVVNEDEEIGDKSFSLGYDDKPKSEGLGKKDGVNEENYEIDDNSGESGQYDFGNEMDADYLG